MSRMPAVLISWKDFRLLHGSFFCLLSGYTSLVLTDSPIFGSLLLWIWFCHMESMHSLFLSLCTYFLRRAVFFVILNDLSFDELRFGAYFKKQGLNLRFMPKRVIWTRNA